MTFWQAIKKRRSCYGFTKEQPVSKEKVESILRDALKYVPSAFNSKSTRIVLLWADNHHKFWNMVKDSIEQIVPTADFIKSAAKIERLFDSGYGTILFYEDQSVVKSMQEKFPLYSDSFPNYSEHTNAMHQFVIWTALAELGLGASLQHYSPLVEKNASDVFGLPSNWKLIAQMPFGAPANPIPDKPDSEIDESLKIIG